MTDPLTYKPTEDPNGLILIEFNGQHIPIAQVLTEYLTTEEAYVITRLTKAALQGYCDYLNQKEGAEMLLGIGVRV